MTTDELIGYYQALLILQYASLPNALATVYALIYSLVQNQVISQFRDSLNVDTAIGAQLDILGTYRGISRTLFGVVAASDWSLVPYNDPSPGSYFGWSDYSAVLPNPTWTWLQYNDLNGAPYKLTDSQMRRLIKLKAALDGWDGSLAEIDNILYSFLGTYVNVIDGENMTMIYQHQTSDPDPDQLFEMAVLAGALPHPSGVASSVVEI